MTAQRRGSVIACACVAASSVWERCHSTSANPLSLALSHRPHLNSSHLPYRRANASLSLSRSLSVNPSIQQSTSQRYLSLSCLMIRKEVESLFVLTVIYSRLPRRPPFRRVLSVGMGVTSSVERKRRYAYEPCVLYKQEIERDRRVCVCVRARTNTTNLHASASKSAEGRLSTRAGRLCAVAAGSTELDVQGGDAELLAASSDILSSQHSSVGRRLIAISLDLHATGDTDEGLAAREIGNVDEGVVERGKDVSNTKDLLASGDDGLVGELLLLLLGLLLGGLRRTKQRKSQQMVQSASDRADTRSLLARVFPRSQHRQHI